MINLCEELKKASNAKHGEFVELKLMSFKKLIDYYKKHDLKKYIRLKYLIYYYPSVYENSTIEDIELTLRYPECVYITLDLGDYRYKVFDTIFKEKYRGDLENFRCGKYIKVNDLFEYFNI